MQIFCKRECAISPSGQPDRKDVFMSNCNNDSENVQQEKIIAKHKIRVAFSLKGYRAFAATNVKRSTTGVDFFEAEEEDDYSDFFILRHDKYYEKEQTLAKNTEFYREYGFFPQATAENKPPNKGDVELYCDGFCEIYNSFKRIKFNGSSSVTVYDDNTVLLHNAEPFAPNVFLRECNSVTAENEPCADALALKRHTPKFEYIGAQMYFLDNRICDNSGSLEIHYDISHGVQLLLSSVLKLEIFPFKKLSELRRPFSSEDLSTLNASNIKRKEDD